MIEAAAFGFSAEKYSSPALHLFIVQRGPDVPVRQRQTPRSTVLAFRNIGPDERNHLLRRLLAATGLVWPRLAASFKIAASSLCGKGKNIASHRQHDSNVRR